MSAAMRRVVGIAVVLAVAVLAVPARALHRETPFHWCISWKFGDPPGGNSSNPFAQGQVARWVTFESTSDLMGNGSTGQEVFLYDNRPPRSLGQVTNFGADSGNPSTDGAGKTVIFDSAADILHLGSTARQIFLWTRQANSFTQITHGTADSTHPIMSEDGKSAVFLSTADLLGTGSTGTQVYLWLSKPVCDLTGCHQIFQLTNQPGESTAARLSPDPAGSYAVFQSTASLVGPSNGFAQIFIYDRSTKLTYQLTAGAGDSTEPSVDASGRFVAFQSGADLLATGSSGSQIFLLDRQTLELRQVTSAGAGDSSQPSISSNGRWIAFVSTANLTGAGDFNPGQHLFIYDILAGFTYQLTNSAGGITANPKATADNLFYFDSTETGLVDGDPGGRQVYVINIFKRVASNVIGTHVFNLQPGDLYGGSKVAVTTADGTQTSNLGTGSLELAVDARDLNGDASVVVAGDGVALPAVPIPGFGALCIEVGDGSGLISCNGGRAGGDVLQTLDHNTNVGDPLCLLGCRENLPCQGPLPGPHRIPCPICLAGACSGGPFAGQTCNTDTQCGSAQCVAGNLWTCNGPLNTMTTGTFQPGGMVLTLDVNMNLSTSPGPDNKFCVGGDDTYGVRDLPGVLRLTTGTSDMAIVDADDTAGATLSAANTGVPFTCNDLQNDIIRGVRFVGDIGVLDVPDVVALPDGIRDLIVSLTLEGNQGPPCVVNCPTPCTQDAECNDGLPCNGVEVCNQVTHTCAAGTPVTCNVCNGETCNPVSGLCDAGTPLTCDDGDACNGVETCDPLIGCVPGSPVNCSDGNACTTDTCNPADGTCSWAPLTCDDGNPCNGTETCDPVVGCLAGTNPIVCSDGDVCNGTETCDPGTGGCLPGTPLTCDDGDFCNGVETCNPSTGCVAGVPIICDPCAGQTCDPGTGVCLPGSPLVCDDGNPCNGVETCVPPGGCTPGTSVACDDGDACNGVETCDVGTGSCLPGTPLACASSDPCAVATCDPSVGCQLQVLDGFDGVFCRLSALQATIDNAPPDKLRRGRARRLVTRLKKVRILVTKASRSSNRVAARRLKRVDRQMFLFMRMVTKSAQRGQISGSVASQLTTLAQDFVSTILPLLGL